MGIFYDIYGKSARKRVSRNILIECCYIEKLPKYIGVRRGIEKKLQKESQ